MLHTGDALRAIKNLHKGENLMRCPKCQALIGVADHEIIIDTGIVECSRCIICGYFEPRDHYNRLQQALGNKFAILPQVAGC